jgi:TetR/AcrR family transcriptional regulator
VARTIDPLQSEAARVQILGAAAAVFAEEGFAGARVDQIARRASINKAMLYYRLGDKRALYQAVLLHFLTPAWEEIERGVRRAGSGAEGLRALIRSVVAMAASSPHFPRLMLRELATGGANLPEPVLEGMARIARLTKMSLEGGRREGSFRKADPLMLHLTLVGAAMALCASAPIRQKLKSRGIEVVRDMRFSEDPGEFLGTLLVSGLSSRGEARPGRGFRAPDVPRKSKKEPT